MLPTIDRRREEPPEPGIFESQGAMVEQIGQPRYIGFMPEGE